MRQGRVIHIAVLWQCMWGRSLRGNSAACLALGWLLVTSPNTNKQIVPFWCWFPGGWACVHSRTLWVSSTDSPVRPGVSPTATNCTDFYSQRFWGFLFPCWNPGLQSVLLPGCSSPFIHMQMWGHLVCQLPPCHASSPSQLQVSTPSTSLNECFFFNSLVVGLPYSSTFWQIWLFIVFKFVVFLLLVVQWGKVCLPMPPSWTEVRRANF